jgi:Thermostable hemolysin
MLNLSSITAPAQAVLRCYGPDTPGRPAVEHFVAQVYAEHYGAQVTDFAPQLVARLSADGQVLAAVGWRSADAGPLFLERYLDTPVHSSLGAGRHQIVEVGHLAAGQAGEGRKLILQMGPHLASLGFQWVVSTLTEELRHLFLRLGIAPQALGVADPAVLGNEAARWGSYYDHHPVVLAGALGPALNALARRGLKA